MTSIVWLRQDLRLRDNPALAAAAADGRPIIPLFVLDDVSPGPWRIGAASRWWLHRSLTRLSRALGGLVLRRGDPREIVPRLARETGADTVYWNRCYEPFAIARDGELKSTLRAAGLRAESFNGALLFEPWEIATGSGGPFKVFTPFWRACRAHAIAPPLGETHAKFTTAGIASDTLEDWSLLPQRPNCAAGFEPIWHPGEAGALARLNEFLRDGLDGYGTLRDRLDLPHISRLSPHLHFGEISPRQIWSRLQFEDADNKGRGTRGASVEKFMSEIGWREFAHHLLYHFPTLADENWRKEFDGFAWRENAAAELRAWRRGCTGYPIVDAAMRELWQTGFIHNRARMIAASFLVKHLRIDWRRGEDWFWDTLLDADLANNAAGWQWVAGSGADASPFFRVFNPILQGRKFDPEGRYVRRYCPELAALPDAFIHAPFEAPAELLASCGVALGETYPHPIVRHDLARKAALEAYQKIRRG